MTPDFVQKLFTRSDGSFHFARWGRPIAPIVFGVEDATVATVKGALEALSVLANHPLAETDPELGSNLMFFFFRDWDELTEVPDLDKLVPELPELVARLKAQEAQQYRFFRFDEAGAIKAAFSFLRMSGALGAVPAENIALGEAIQLSLLWSDQAFAQASPLARTKASGGEGAVILRPDIAAVVRAAYDPVLPASERDPAFALRLTARAARESAAMTSEESS